MKSKGLRHTSSIIPDRFVKLLVKAKADDALIDYLTASGKPYSKGRSLIVDKIVALKEMKGRQDG